MKNEGKGKSEAKRGFWVGYMYLISQICGSNHNKSSILDFGVRFSYIGFQPWVLLIRCKLSMTTKLRSAGIHLNPP